jgi:hypothetical protein
MSIDCSPTELATSGDPSAAPQDALAPSALLAAPPEGAEEFSFEEEEGSWFDD